MFPQGAIWIKGIVILTAVQTGVWMYVTIAQFKEIGWA